MTIFYTLKINETTIQRYCQDLYNLEFEMLYFIPKMMFKQSMDKKIDYKTLKEFINDNSVSLTFIDNLSSDDIRYFFNDDISWDIYKEYSKQMLDEGYESKYYIA